VLLSCYLFVSFHSFFEIRKPVSHIRNLELILDKERSFYVLKAVSDNAPLLPVEATKVLVKLCGEFRPLHDKVTILHVDCISRTSLDVLLFNLYLAIAFGEVYSRVWIIVHSPKLIELFLSLALFLFVFLFSFGSYLLFSLLRLRILGFLRLLFRLSSFALFGIIALVAGIPFALGFNLLLQSSRIFQLLQKLLP
jgi:hypothetical protein